MRKHFCDLCGGDLTGEVMYLLDLYFYNDKCEKKWAAPQQEVCPLCKEWLRECIELKKEKREEEQTTTEVL